MDPIFAVGDIHGRNDELQRVLRLIELDAEAGAPVVFLGDFVDRGPHSRAVIETLRAGQADGRDWITLAGNHDLYFRDFLDPGAMTHDGARAWLGDNLGGSATLGSYGMHTDRRAVSDLRAEAARKVDSAHRDWLNALPRLYETSDQIFVHAGIRPGVALAHQDPAELVTIRGPFLDDPRDHGRMVVHGHTAAEGPLHCGNRVNLDGGAGFGRPLCAALILGRDVFLLSEEGRVPLLPGQDAPLPNR